MDWTPHAKLWNYAHIRVMDVRSIQMSKGEKLVNYRLPTSTYLYASRGEALIQLADHYIEAKPHMLLHGGKGASLDINASEEFQYYMVMYKCSFIRPMHRSWNSWLEKNNPFQQSYVVYVSQPLYMIERLIEMDKQWKLPNGRDKLLVKANFYQFVHEYLRQMEEEGIDPLISDLVGQAIRYMEEHYHEPITLEMLGELLACNSRMLLRRFKLEWNTTPIDYLIRLRMDRALDLLRYSTTPIKDIAAAVGYDDHYYFSRLFKKQIGISPMQFRSKAQHQEQLTYSPSLLSRLSIATNGVQRYIDNGINNHSQYTQKGEFNMYSKTRRSIAIMVICFTMLLGACGGGTTNVNTAKQTAPATSTVDNAGATETTEVEATNSSRVVKHAMGEETIVGTPERIVILTNEGTEALLSVGVTPVGAVQSWVGDPWYEHIAEKMEGVEVVGDELQPNIELIASLKPDLIIGNKVRQEKIYEQLKEIAPTIYSDDLAGDWKINFTLYMEALGKKEEGEKLMAAFDQRVAEASAQLADKLDTKVSVARFSASQVRIYQKQTFSGVLLDQLGFARPESQDKDSFIEVMTKETIPSMDGDVLFYFVTEAAGKTDAANVVKEWMEDPLFKNLEVAKNNKVIAVEEAIWNTAGGYQAANLLLDEIIAYFEQP